MLKLWKQPQSSHEDLFIERYQRLLAWSLKLTAHDRQLAEDLLHDAYVQFTLNRPELGAIHDLDAYLYTMLRNSHVSHLRRALNVRSTSLSMVEFDSLEIGLRVTDVQDQIKVQDELRLICHYATLRKQNSKAGSVLILRFFHGYYPSEIAQVMRSNWLAVAKWLQLARNEAALYLEDPEALGFIKHTSAEPKPQLGFARSTENLLEELRQMIFSTRHNDCPSQRRLRELYRDTHAEAIDSTTLAHIVSCPTCLDSVNHILGLPMLNQRYPTDMTGRDTRPKGGSGGPPPSAGGGKDLITRSVRRVKETFEHRPKELRIAVNGFVQVSQKVSSDRMEQTLSLDLEEKPDFVEVFSEQWIRLLLLNVEPPPDGAFEQRRCIDLSEGRSLVATLNFSGPCPDLHVIYEDPTLVQLQNSTVAIDSPEGEVEVQSPTSNVQSPLGTNVGLWTNLRRRWTDVGLSTLDFGLLFRPSTITALFAFILIAAVLLFFRVPTQSLSGADLLQRSTAAEESIAARANQVVHRTISLEERTTQGVVISRRRLDVWRNGTQGLAALRVYDEQNQVVNGEWTKGGTSRVLLHHGAKLQPRPGLKPSASSIGFADSWQVLPSAQSFSQLIEHIEKATVTESASEYTINYQRDAATADGLQRATLVLSRPELRAIKQTLLVRQGSEMREYTFSESSFELRPASAVAPAVFEPDPEVLGGDTGTGRHGDAENVPVSPSLPLSASPALATAELEVEVVRQLNQANAFLGEQISVERTSEGQLRVKGIVENEQRKDELLQSLTAFKGNPAVKIEIATVAEALKRQKQSSSAPVTVTEVESGGGEIPVEAELRQHFSKRGVPAEQLNQEIQRFSARLLNRSLQARRHALAMKQIAERFSLDDLRNLDPNARANWRAMLAQHARLLQQETAALRREVEQAFPPLAASSIGGLDVTSDETVVRAVQQLFALAVSNDDNMRRSFAIYAGKQGVAPVKTPQFWQSLKSAEALAGLIGKQ
ncbi:MAG TPA: RNA polymerase sigma factor [Pyrinomonadaceae bacterium]|jgi:DNA-directed RNA polymerase specialized sigma24 family protein